MSTARKHLKVALEERLLPVFLQAGFVGPSTLSGPGLCHHFCRREGDNRYKFLTVQFEKRGGPKFRLNFSEATQEGLEQRRRFIEERSGRPVTEDMHCEPWGSFRGNLHPSRLPYLKLFTWFNARGDGASEIVARRVVALYPEIETWWRERKVGPHLWIPDLFGQRRKRTEMALRDGTNDA